MISIIPLLKLLWLLRGFGVHDGALNIGLSLSCCIKLQHIIATSKLTLLDVLLVVIEDSIVSMVCPTIPVYRFEYVQSASVAVHMMQFEIALFYCSAMRATKSGDSWYFSKLQSRSALKLTPRGVRQSPMDTLCPQLAVSEYKMLSFIGSNTDISRGLLQKVLDYNPQQKILEFSIIFLYR